ncbi:unnamed protein product, partial [Bubo scandiacus]
ALRDPPGALGPPPPPPTLAPALLQTLAGGGGPGGGGCCGTPPACPRDGAPAWTCSAPSAAPSPSLGVALVAAAASRQPLAAATCTFSLILTLLFAFDFFVTFRTRVAPPGPGHPKRSSEEKKKVQEKGKTKVPQKVKKKISRTLFVVPFLMGPPGSALAQPGLQLTDSGYVAASMRLMTRVGHPALPALAQGDFIRCLHSVGRPPEDVGSHWPCDPARTLVAHEPARRRIVSYGSGYGGNSLLGKKCVALRLAAWLAREGGWLAEHMLIVGVTDPAGHKRYLAAAFPSACGKTNLAMMRPALPGWRVQCVGDDIAWMKFDSQGRLRAINPEFGFFGVAPGTSTRTNPAAMATIQANTIFTNVGQTSDGGVYWEGLEETLPPGTTITSWLGQPWSPGDPQPCAHPNSRFCAPASQCPVMDPAWEDPEGVPIDAIIFGGRRPEGVPLVYEAFDWRHGVFIGSAMRSEATAAAEHTGRRLLHDPFAMRPFFGYNAGQYLAHWLAMGEREGAQLPRFFHVNWFLRGPDGRFLWPGFGHNARVLAWICGRLAGAETATENLLVISKTWWLLSGLGGHHQDLVATLKI